VDFNKRMAEHWKVFDKKSPPTAIILASGFKEKPDLWIDPTKSCIVQVLYWYIIVTYDKVICSNTATYILVLFSLLQIQNVMQSCIRSTCSMICRSCVSLLQFHNFSPIKCVNFVFRSSVIHFCSILHVHVLSCIALKLNSWLTLESNIF
jgi:hypothetical protein